MKVHFFANLMKVGFVVSSLLFLQRCITEETNPVQQPSLINFTPTQFAFGESDGEQTISLILSKAFAKDTKVLISVMESPAGSYHTEPAVVNSKLTVLIPAGQQQASFKFVPTDNALLDGRKQVTFTVITSAGEYKGGTAGSLVVDINDDEVAATAGFPNPGLQVNEGTTGPTNVQVALSAPAPADGMLVLELSSDARYGVDFYTVPAAVEQRVFLPVQTGSTSVGFSILPVNDAVRRDDRVISVAMVHGSGGVCTGESSPFEAVIVDDDNYDINKIQALRALYTGFSRMIDGEYYVEGVVTSVSNITPGKFYIEDGEYGIRVSISSGKSFAKGDVVLLNMKNSVIDLKHGGLEVAQVSDAVLVTPGEITPAAVSLQELLESDSFQSRYVQVNNLVFANADGATRMFGDHVATDGERTIIVRTSGFATFRDEELPSGNLSVAGILSIEDGNFVLYPQVYHEDIIADNSALRPWSPGFPGRRPAKGTTK